MNDTINIEGEIAINGENRPFSFEYEPDPEKSARNHKLLLAMEHPWKLIKQGRSLGIHAARKFLPIVLLFIVVNFMLVIYAVYHLVTSGVDVQKILYTLLVTVLGILFTAYAGYRAYHYMILDALRVIYQNSGPLFRKISHVLVDKAGEMIKSHSNMDDEKIREAIDSRKIIKEYYTKAPWLLQKGIRVILERLPVAGMLKDLYTQIESGDKAKASEILYTKMDTVIMDTVFARLNTRKWVIWLLLINFAVLVLIVQVKIH